MDFTLTEAQLAFRDDLRDWLERNVPAEFERQPPYLPDAGEARESLLRDWQRRLHQGGWAGIHWPEEYGGRGTTLIEGMIYDREMARFGAPQKFNGVGVNLVGPTLIELGTDDQKERYLSNILDGTELWCQGFSEPDAGSDVASLKTSAVREGDQFIVNGQKVWTSYAHMADMCFLLARTDSSGTKHEGITAFIVDMDQSCVETEPIYDITDEHTFNQVYFDDVEISENEVVGQVDEGWDVTMTMLSFEHGLSDIFTHEYRFRDLETFHRQRDYDDQLEEELVRRQLAEFYTRIQAAKLVHYNHVTRSMAQDSPDQETSMDVIVSDELGKDLNEFGVNLLGPGGALCKDDVPKAEWPRDYLWSFGKWIAGGTGDIQRNIIGEGVLDLPKDPRSKKSHVDEAGYKEGE